MISKGHGSTWRSHRQIIEQQKNFFKVQLYKMYEKTLSPLVHNDTTGIQGWGGGGEKKRGRRGRGRKTGGKREINKRTPMEVPRLTIYYFLNW